MLVQLLDGFVVTATVAPLPAPDGILPFKLNVWRPNGYVTVSVKVTIMLPEDHVASTGPATTTPFSSTSDTLVRRPVDADEVAMVKTWDWTEMASPLRSITKPPSG